MAKICIVTGITKKGKWVSLGARDLHNALREKGAQVIRAESPQAGYLNVGWGKPGGQGGLNPKLPPNKLWELETLTAKQVPTVPFSKSYASITQFAKGFSPARPVVGRKLSHTQGKDIIISYPIAALKPTTYHPPAAPRDFWTVLLPKQAEFRVHVFRDKAVRSGTKMKLGVAHSHTPPNPKAIPVRFEP